ncbi:MAG: DUF2959 family protein [Planctomycetes bacterium]|nr:DUF2959 family protein [Planctomycetota bacterium]
MQHRTKFRPSLALAVLLAGCASGPDRQHAPVKVEEMMTWIERVHIEAERARDALSDSFERLNTLAGGRFEGESAAVVYARFVQSIDVAEEQARRYREVVEPMLGAAGPVFAAWQEDVARIQSERLRQRSELRFQLAKERYEAIAKVAVPAQQQLDAFVSSLRDHALFLGHDLNAGSIDDIQEEVKLVAQNALQLDQNLESAMAASRAYVEQSSMPAATPGR